MQPPEKPKHTPEVQQDAEARAQDDNGLSVVTETLLSGTPSWAQEEAKFTDTAVPAVTLPDPQESEH